MVNGTPADFNSWWEPRKVEVEQQVASHLNVLLRRVESEFRSPAVERVVRQFNDFCLGGKMLRAALVELGYLAAGGRNIPQIRQLQAAVEIVHSSLLAHDDVIDRSSKRRGKPTLHVAAEQYHREQNYLGDPVNYGRAMGILSGDLGSFIAMDLALTCGLRDGDKLAAMRLLFGSLVETACGEIMDVDVAALPHPTENDIFQATKFKTANYTIVAPMRLGEIAAAVRRSLEAAIKGFGLPLGQAYQIRDDYLGLFAEEAETGKPAISDLAEGKKSYLWFLAMQRGDDSQKRRLRALFGSESVGPPELEEVRSLLRSMEVDRAASERVDELVQAAVDSIPALTTDEGLRAVLAGLCRTVSCTSSGRPKSPR